MTSSEPTIREFWQRRAERSGADTFLLAEGERWTYDDFDRFANRLAHGLRAAGVGAGTKIAIMMPNSVELLRVELAIHKLGGIVVPLIPGSTLAEASHVIETSRAQVLIADEPEWRTVRDAEELVARLDSVFVVGARGARAYSALLSEDESDPPDHGLGPLDPAAIMYTSGSTSKPKGVLQPQVGLASAGAGFADRLAMTPADNYLCAMPLFHTGATHMALAPVIAAGASMTLMPAFRPSQFWDVARESGSTLAGMVPTMLSLLEAQPPTPRDREHGVRLLVTHVRPEAAVERFGVDICTVWGMTETSGMGTLTEPGYEDYAPQLIGWPFPDEAEVRVVDGDGAAVPAGTEGELRFRHPHCMLEYHDDAANTAATLVDGWVGTGDLCSLDERGRVFFHGRLKNVIKRSGENVASEEVEFALITHPEVQDCVVVGVPDEIRVEEVHATVVLSDAGSIGEDEVAAWAARQLSPWKVPRYVRFESEDLPRLPNGKVDRAAVAAAVDVAASWDRRAELERSRGTA